MPAGRPATQHTKCVRACVSPIVLCYASSFLWVMSQLKSSITCVPSKQVRTYYRSVLARYQLSVDEVLRR